jgi:GDPmannose 4,6-dehydratase
MRALVIGAAGQDGSFLCEQLDAEGAQVFSLTRQGMNGPIAFDRTPIMLSDRAAMMSLVEHFAFDQIYYLAAYHHSAEDRVELEVDIVRRSFSVHVDGLLNVLEAMAATRSQASLFYAASSHVFGIVAETPQTELTPLAPICPYGISKSAGVQLCRLYRNEHGVRASVGFLFNHESPRRPPRFLSRKVARAVVEIRRGLRDQLTLGDLETQSDWGYSPEYTDAMRRILALDEPGDYVIASGRAACVREFVAAAFARMGLDWRDHVKIDPSLVQKVKRGPLVGNPEKLVRTTGWTARTTLGQLAAIMVDAEQVAGGA